MKGCRKRARSVDDIEEKLLEIEEEEVGVDRREAGTRP